MGIAENLTDIKQRIEKAARRAGRSPEEITLLAATKDVDVKRIAEAIKAGQRVFGENYVQEAKGKIEKFKKKLIEWHFIGGLQRNKAKYAVKLFKMIESVDSFELAKELSKKAAALDILIQVNIAREKTKGGVEIKDLGNLVRKIAELPNVRIMGLMTIPPFGENPQLSRPYFVTLRRLAEKINREHIPGVVMTELSMGMTDDFEVAIEEGATIVRIGRAIFGERKEKGDK
jgi:pyridoxal phosphate enzyme (YggS family)